MSPKTPVKNTSKENLGITSTSSLLQVDTS
jgi:hypothetical protein